MKYVHHKKTYGYDISVAYEETWCFLEPVVGNWKTVNGYLIVEFGFFSFSGFHVTLDLMYSIQ